MYDKCFVYSLLLKKKIWGRRFFLKISLYIHRDQTGFSKRIMPLKKKNIYGITFYTEILKRKVDLGDFIFFICEKTNKSTLQFKISVQKVFSFVIENKRFSSSYSNQ
jgi:hypothetical protein